uniref:Uncharacterized protein n=1 Tax=Picea glauca TaxID=3330 RepID=A0A101M261_PICGL|nr:hypothetical protein ABT39_MTgene2887 [Picea glauca]QHR87582.1 hypothetical protein Q903MT_gene1593 [Picea sitchensis]
MWSSAFFFHPPIPSTYLKTFSDLNLLLFWLMAVSLTSHLRLCHLGHQLISQNYISSATTFCWSS